MHSGRAAAALAVAAFVLTAGLTGCSPSDTTESESGSGNLVLHPTGDEGRWFDDAYGEGSVQLYATSNDFCGIAGTLAIEQQVKPDRTTRVQARDLRSGDVVWELEDVGCSAGSVSGEGSLLLLPGDPLGGTWSFADPETGETVQRFELEASPLGGRIVSEFDGIRVIEATGGVLVGIGASGVLWERGVVNGDVTPLADGMIGVKYGLEDRIEVIDGRTGERRHKLTGTEAHEVQWASDGYVLQINQSDPEYAYFDLDGEEVARTKEHSVYGFVPKPRSGVTFSVEDFAVADKVTAVGLDGRPALFDTGYEDYATQRGPIEELPSSILDVQAVSADGSLLLFPDDGTDSLVMIDDAGEEVLRWTTPESTEVRVEAGFIVLQQAGTTTVLLPAD